MKSSFFWMLAMPAMPSNGLGCAKYLNFIVHAVYLLISWLSREIRIRKWRERNIQNWLLFVSTFVVAYFVIGNICVRANLSTVMEANIHSAQCTRTSVSENEFPFRVVCKDKTWVRVQILEVINEPRSGTHTYSRFHVHANHSVNLFFCLSSIPIRIFILIAFNLVKQIVLCCSIFM